jgi:hypothetical protein
MVSLQEMLHASTSIESSEGLSQTSQWQQDALLQIWQVMACW